MMTQAKKENIQALKFEYEQLRSKHDGLLKIIAESELPEMVYNSNAVENSSLTKKHGDFCMLAELNGKTVGGAWLRILNDEIKGFGNIDSETPELAIAVFKEYRHLGIGTGLLNNIIDLTFNSRGYKQISLSVDKASYAVEMYRKLGFEIVKENERDYTMVLKRK
jgi:GNAT superfamily N-acetyltransferase